MVDGGAQQVTAAAGQPVMEEGAKPATAVLLIGYGGPHSLDAVEPFLTRLMGRPPDPGLLEQVTRRYLTIGGSSPMLPIAKLIAEGLEERLTTRGHAVPVTFGMRYAPPLIGEVMGALHESGIRRIVTVSLSPYESAISTGACRAAIGEACAVMPDVEVAATELLHTLPAFNGLLIGGAAGAIHDLKDVSPKLVVFTAHSVPVTDDGQDDPYVSQLRDVLDRVVSGLQMAEGTELDGGAPELPGIAAYGNLGDPQPWVFAYQSKGRRPGPWLGPDLDDVIDAAIEGGFAGVALCPIGFAIDNMETRYDLDVVAADRLLGADIEYSRAGLPNDDPLLLDAIADMVEPLLSDRE